MAERRPKKKATKSRGGRPSKYSAEYPRQAEKLCWLGATDVQVAEFFGVTVSTLTNWKKEHPEFLAALRKARTEADEQVVKSLFRRALGYRHKAVKIFADAKTGSEHVVAYTERYPPDTTACIFWLKNRMRDQWRDRREIDAAQDVVLPQSITLRLVDDAAPEQPAAQDTAVTEAPSDPLPTDED
jgi:hypothetical protein